MSLDAAAPLPHDAAVFLFEWKFTFIQNEIIKQMKWNNLLLHPLEHFEI